MTSAILLIGNLVTSSNIVKLLLNSGYEFDCVNQFDEAQMKLISNDYKTIIVLDEGYSEVQKSFIQFIKGKESLQFIPLLILTTIQDVHYRTDYFDLGFDDVIVTPVTKKELLTKIKSWVNRIDSFEKVAYRDPLTKAYNRRYFDYHVQLELSRAHRNQYPISIAFIDADKFKLVNDTYGHHIGDLVLQGLSKRLLDNTRTADVVARFGGEEFVVLLPNCNGQQAAEKIQSILDVCRKEPMAVHMSQEYHITFSSGVAEWEEGMPVEQWIKIADDGVYYAKEQGRNRVVLSNLSVKNTESEKLLSINLLVVGNLSVDSLQSLNVGKEILFKQVTNLDNVDLEQVDILIYLLDKNFDQQSFIRDTERLPQSSKKIVITKKKVESEVYQSIGAGIDALLCEPYSIVDLEIILKQLQK